jgi:uncharacterized repeat protein (TIGR04138 family)
VSDPIVKLWDGISASTGVPLEGLSFTYAAFDFNRERITRESGGVEYPQRHCTGAEFCTAFVQLAKNTFGDDYIAALTSWQLNTSEKLGQIVFALVERKLIGKQEGDLQGDFDGQFDFSKLAPDPPPARAYEYPTAKLHRLVYPLHPQPRRPSPVIFALIFVAVWFSTMVAGAAIAAQMGWNNSPMAIHVVAALLGGLALSQYPYRFSLRTLLITVTALALACGLLAYLMRLRPGATNTPKNPLSPSASSSNA